MFVIILRTFYYYSLMLILHSDYSLILFSYLGKAGPYRARRGAGASIFGATFLKQVYLSPTTYDFLRIINTFLKNHPGQAGIDKERSHEFRDGLLVLTIAEMSSVSLMTAELRSFD